MQVIDFLDKSGVSYTVSEHKPTFTAQHMAAAEHEAGQFVAKPVVVKADDKNIMCVLGADHKIDLKALKEQLGAQTAELLSEEDLGEIFKDCELGAEPPLGNLYDLPVIIDKSIESDDHIVFQAGSHKKSVRMSMADYRKLVSPKVLSFSYQMGR